MLNILLSVHSYNKLTIVNLYSFCLGCLATKQIPGVLILKVSQRSDNSQEIAELFITSGSGSSAQESSRIRP